jgi:hypothetical protein
LLINNGDNIYTGGFFLTTDSTTGFNGVSTGSSSFSWGKNTNTTPTRPNDINFTGLVYVDGEANPYYIGFSPDVKAYGYISASTSDTGVTRRIYSGSTSSIIGESLYKHNSLGQTITLYMAIGTSYNGNYSVTTPSGLSASAQTNYIYSLAGVILQPISTLVISSGVRSFNSINSTYLGANIKYLSDIDTSTSTAIGYGANIDVSNQIVLGTSGEFVCIPSKRGLSIGKSTAPASSYVLDVSGSINFSGNLDQDGDLFRSGSGSGGSGTSNSINGDFFVSGDISGNGNLDITGDISGNGDLFVRGSVEASSYNATSDYRIKDNIRNLDDSDTISNLRPVKYVNKLSNKNDFGLIAHELQLEYPDLVSGTKDGTEYQSVNYTGLISILIKEIQDLKIITSNQTIKLESQATQLERINKILFPND